jgi:hypothetical protein
MMWVLLMTIGAGTFIMTISLILPLGLINTIRDVSGTNSTALTSLATTNMARDVLPFATGLIGFAAGLVTAIYGRTVQGDSI